MTDESAVQTVNTVRNVWNDRLVPLAWLAGLGGSVCFGFAIWSSIRLGRSWLRRGSLVLVAAGLASAGTWGVLRLALGDPFDSLYQSPSLPAGLATVIRDVGQNLLTSADQMALRVALAPALVGGVVLAARVLFDLLPVARRNSRPVIAVVAGAVVVVLVGAGLYLRPATDKVRGEVCNGRADLCDLRLDQVVMAGSHNSQAAADADFLGPNQDWTIPRQMQSGVRALLIKSMYWETPDKVEGFLDTLPADTASTVKSLIDTALPPKSGTWMCHNICVLGATPLETGFQWIREFVETHPDEVLMVIVGDTISVDDTFAAARGAGLDRRVYTPDDDPNAPWPTLEQMIMARQNVVVFSEHEDAPGTWYRNFYLYAMETPFDYKSTADFSCAPNRGAADRHLFLMNNWVTRAMASREEAGPANDAMAVEHRAIQCGEEQGRAVNLVAANFVDIPDVFTAVDDLNNRAVQASRTGSRPDVAS